MMIASAWLTRLRGLWPNRSIGQRGERLAARYLRSRGYAIVARSQRNTIGEIDLIAVDGRTIVFVEVKTRADHEAGHPAEAVDDHKQRQLTRLAASYLKHHGLLEHPARFDVVALTYPAGGKPRIEHFESAFAPQGLASMFS
jgi:putative endonuclease